MYHPMGQSVPYHSSLSNHLNAPHGFHDTVGGSLVKVNDTSYVELFESTALPHKGFTRFTERLDLKLITTLEHHKEEFYFKILDI